MSASDADSFEVASNVDITKLPLTPEEGFVVARVLGRRFSLADLTREGVIPAPRVRPVVESLIRKGALMMVSGKVSAPKNVKDPYAGIIFNASDMNEAADLTEEQRKRILFVEMNLGEWSHYKLLGAKRTSTQAEIKAAYFKSSKEFHPDAFFRKNLGSYKERLDTIFKAMKAAYDLLSDPEKRARYDETAIIELTPEDEAELERLAEVKRKEREAEAREQRNQARQKESRLGRNPMLERIKRGRELMDLAETAHKAGRLDGAANQARLALSFADSDAMKDRAKSIIRDADRTCAQQLIKRVQQVLASPMDLRDMQDEVNRIADQAAEIAIECKDGALLADVARALLTLKRPARAAKIGQLACDADPRNPRAFEVLALAASTDDKWTIALRAAERWLNLEPNSAAAKDMVKAAKRKV
jgi:curved DNA-binding protein CbpA